MLCRNRKCLAEIPDDALYCQYCGRRQEPTPRKSTRRPNKTGSVYYMGDGRKRPWRIEKNGVTIGYAATKIEALKHLERLTDTPITDKYRFSFSQVYEHWKLEHFRDLTPSGIEGYSNAYKHFEPLYQKEFRNLSLQDFQQIIDKLACDGKSDSLQGKLKQLVGQMSKWALREKIITVNYAPFIKINESAKTEKRIFTEKEIELLRSDNSDEARIVLIMIYTGVRINEIFNIKLTDIFGDYMIGGSKSEAGKNRVIPIPNVAKGDVEYFAAKATATLLDGYSGNKTPKNFTRREYKELMSRLDITGTTPHCTRHTYASQAVKRDAKPELLQKMLGHAAYSTTVGHYVHLDTQSLVDEVNKIWT